MKAALLTGIRQMEIRDVPDPQITTAGEVLLRINAVGVCGSDVHYYTTGRIASLVVEHPCMTGHECAATVVEASPEVKNLEAGQRVAVDPLVWCGHCDQCLAGRRHTCRNQTFLACPGQAPGALAEYLVMPAANCFPVPGNMNDDEATTIEPLSIGLHAQRLAGRPGPRRAAILGVGPIGLSVLLCLRAAGTKEIFVTDLLEERLAMARRLGADWTGRPTQQDVVAEMLQRVPEGMDCVFECAGRQETLDQGAEVLAPGGSLMLIGIPQEQWVRFRPETIRRKELRLQNVRRQNECVQDAIDLVASGQADVKKMVTHHFPLGRTREAFDMAADYRDGVVKAIINVSGA
ncbi:MAG: alcohol dehydrogenase catalytic domain-containing protein [Phycisphaerae bacterium]|jgi:L-iditol 2-dehydrogenase|nr:alcohol dehydrogenase catalytic domain-containing protein [Phycisphaerae bacterium]